MYVTSSGVFLYWLWLGICNIKFCSHHLLCLPNLLNASKFVLVTNIVRVKHIALKKQNTVLNVNEWVIVAEKPLINTVIVKITVIMEGFFWTAISGNQFSSVFLLDN